MKQKKLLSILLAAIMIVSLLAGCSSVNTADNSDTAAQESEQQTVTNDNTQGTPPGDPPDGAPNGDPPGEPSDGNGGPGGTPPGDEMNSNNCAVFHHRTAAVCQSIERVAQPTYPYRTGQEGL